MKDLSEFHKRSDRKIGVQPHCKACQKTRKANYSKTPKGIELGKVYTKKYYYENREKALECNREWRTANKAHRDAYLDNYEKNHRERDPVQLAEWRKSYRQKCLSTKPAFRLNGKMSASIRRGLIHGKGGNHWESLVGYTCSDLAECLKKTIPRGYDWKDFLDGITDLEIDHIVPVAVFNFETADDIDFKRCWALTNLQLLPKLENRSKAKKLFNNFQPALLIG